MNCDTEETDACYYVVKLSFLSRFNPHTWTLCLKWPFYSLYVVHFLSLYLLAIISIFVTDCYCYFFLTVWPKNCTYFLAKKNTCNIVRSLYENGNGEGSHSWCACNTVVLIYALCRYSELRLTNQKITRQLSEKDEQLQDLRQKVDSVSLELRKSEKAKREVIYEPHL